MEEAKKKLLIRGVIIAGIVGSVVGVASSKSKISDCITTYCKTTTDFIKFLNENRSEIIEQVKATSDKVTNAIDVTNHDLKAISENIKHLKKSSSEMIHTVQNTKDQLVTMFESTKQKYQVETIIQNLEEKMNT